MPYTIVVQAELSEIARIAAWSDAFAAECKLPPRTLFALQLCLEEQVSNIICHGVPDGAIRLALELAGDTVVATVEDHGAGFNPLDAPAPEKPQSLDDARVGGLGIHLLRKFATAVDYERRDEINRLTLRFALPPH
jgi:serine/threonine-protein kinase RsbW